MDFLTEKQLQELTGYQLNAYIVPALRQMNIVHRVRPDGFPIVLVEHLKIILGVKNESIKSGKEPNFDRV